MPASSRMATSNHVRPLSRPQQGPATLCNHQHKTLGASKQTNTCVFPSAQNSIVGQAKSFVFQIVQSIPPSCSMIATYQRSIPNPIARSAVHAPHNKSTGARTPRTVRGLQESARTAEATMSCQVGSHAILATKLLQPKHMERLLSYYMSSCAPCMPSLEAV